MIRFSKVRFLIFPTEFPQIIERFIYLNFILYFATWVTQEFQSLKLTFINLLGFFYRNLNGN